jgi:hypothetical protein
MEILAQPLCETVFTPTTFRHTKRLPIKISNPSHKKFHFKKPKEKEKVTYNKLKTGNELNNNQN